MVNLMLKVTWHLLKLMDVGCDMTDTDVLDMFQVTTPGAPRLTLYGRPGMGKTTLASKFPDPFFILTEDPECPGLKASPVFNDYPLLIKTIKQLLAKEILPFKTLVIDTVTKLDIMIVNYTIQQSPLIGKDKREPGTLAESWGGYGSGFEKAASLHRLLKHLLDKFKERGIAVIYIAHSEVKKYKSPEHEDYDIISIQMNSDKSRCVYIDDVDGVLFCKERAHVIETESKRNIVKGTGQRVISAHCNEVHVSKNRFNIQKEIPMTFEELSKHIPFYKEV